MNPDAPINNNIGAYPAIIRGREGRMNGQIIRYLALNGPSLIYSVSQDLASRAETKVHYPTVNRRMHELVRRQYLEKAGTRITKAGIPADLYATRLRGDFAALTGIPDSSGKYASELSPKEIRQTITIAASREGSPFVLFKYILEEGQSGIALVDKELVPEIVNSVRNGYLNIDALDEGVICSAFASVIARKMTNLMTMSGRHQSGKSKETHRDQVDILMRSLEKTLARNRDSVSNTRMLRKDVTDPSRLPTQKSRIAPVMNQWGNELKVFLKLHSVRLD